MRSPLGPGRPRPSQVAQPVLPPSPGIPRKERHWPMPSQVCHILGSGFLRFLNLLRLLLLGHPGGRSYIVGKNRIGELLGSPVGSERTSSRSSIEDIDLRYLRGLS